MLLIYLPAIDAVAAISMPRVRLIHHCFHLQRGREKWPPMSDNVSLDAANKDNERAAPEETATTWRTLNTAHTYRHARSRATAMPVRRRRCSRKVPRRHHELEDIFCFLSERL